MKYSIKFLAWALLLAATGCATPRVQVTARGNPQRPVAPHAKIAVAEPNRLQPGLEGLYQALLEGLKVSGFQVVAPADADYQLVWMRDRSTRTVLKAQTPVMLDHAPAYIPGVPNQTVRLPRSGYATPELATEVRVSEGIRLTLYPARARKPSEVQIVWDGFIDSGRAHLPAGKERVLVQTLLRHFGRDFTGPVLLPK